MGSLRDCGHHPVSQLAFSTFSNSSLWAIGSCWTSPGATPSCPPDFFGLGVGVDGHGWGALVWAEHVTEVIIEYIRL